MTNEHRYEICAGIDFGTTYSGLAYSYSSEKDRVYIISQWPGGIVSNKIPTAVLFDKNKQLVAFGDLAVSKYCEHVEDGDIEDFYFFHRFKMILYENKGINEDMYLEDEGGKKMKAIIVFSEITRFMMNYLIDALNKRNTQNCLNDTSVRWVLTVPAVWSYSAKVFMRKAAERAGIQSHHLVIALEPECASLYCQNESKEKMSGQVEVKKNDTKYLVMDNGGGTIDVIAHEFTKNHCFKEIFRATGSNWGGTKVDQLFIEYLEQLFTKKNVAEVKREHKDYWLQLLKDLESAKRNIGLKYQDSTASIPFSKEIWNVKHFNKTDEVIRRGAYIKGKRLKVNIDVIKDMIEQVSSEVKRHGESLLKFEELKDIDAILMVGGFSNSAILLNSIKEIVGSNIPVVVPEEAELAVVKGAVLFGWNQDKIVARRAKYTYGYECVDPFESGKHSEKYAYFCTNKDGERELFCRNVFKTFVTVNQEIKYNETITTYLYAGIDQTEVSIPLFVTRKEEVSYTDDESVECIGELKLSIPDNTKGDDRMMSVEFILGETELKVKATNTIGETTEGSFALLSN